MGFCLFVGWYYVKYLLYFQLVHYACGKVGYNAIKKIFVNASSSGNFFDGTFANRLKEKY